MSVVSEIFEACGVVDPLYGGRSLSNVLGSLMSEVGELSEEVSIVEGYSYKSAGADGVVGEAVDCIACLVDLIYVYDKSIGEDRLVELLRPKLDKWVSKVREKNPPSLKKDDVVDSVRGDDCVVRGVEVMRAGCNYFHVLDSDGFVFGDWLVLNDRAVFIRRSDGFNYDRGCSTYDSVKDILANHYYGPGDFSVVAVGMADRFPDSLRKLGSLHDKLFCSLNGTGAFGKCVGFKIVCGRAVVSDAFEVEKVEKSKDCFNLWGCGYYDPGAVKFMRGHFLGSGDIGFVVSKIIGKYSEIVGAKFDDSVDIEVIYESSNTAVENNPNFKIIDAKFDDIEVIYENFDTVIEKNPKHKKLCDIRAQVLKMLVNDDCHSFVVCGADGKHRYTVSLRYDSISEETVVVCNDSHCDEHGMYDFVGTTQKELGYIETAVRCVMKMVDSVFTAEKDVSVKSLDEYCPVVEKTYIEKNGKSITYIELPGGSSIEGDAAEAIYEAVSAEKAMIAGCKLFELVSRDGSKTKYGEWLVNIGSNTVEWCDAEFCNRTHFLIAGNGSFNEKCRIAIGHMISTVMSIGHDVGVIVPVPGARHFSVNLVDRTVMRNDLLEDIANGRRDFDVVNFGDYFTDGSVKASFSISSDDPNGWGLTKVEDDSTELFNLTGDRLNCIVDIIMSYCYRNKVGVTPWTVKPKVDEGLRSTLFFLGDLGLRFFEVRGRQDNRRSVFEIKSGDGKWRVEYVGSHGKGDASFDCLDDLVDFVVDFCKKYDCFVAIMNNIDDYKSDEVARVDRFNKFGVLFVVGYTVIMCVLAVIVGACLKYFNVW